MQGWIEPLGWMLVHSMWWILLITAVTGMMLTVLKRAPASLRYVVGGVGIALSLATLPASLAWVLMHSETPRVIARNSHEWLNVTVDDAAGLAGDVPLDDVGLQRDMRGLPRPTEATSLTDLGVLPRVKIRGRSRLNLPLDRAPMVESTFAERFRTRLRPYLGLIVIGWLAGVFLLSLRPLIGWRTAHRLRRVGLTEVPAAISAAMHRLAVRLRLSRAVAIFQSSLVHVPCVIGVVKPVILLPASAITGLTPQQLEAVLAHELAHVCRGDFLMNALQTVAETLLFYHPAIWWLSRRVRHERELCCDDLAISLCNPAEYCRALMAIEQLRGTASVFALGATDGSLVSRVRRIAAVDDPSSTRWPVPLLAVVSMLLTGLVFFNFLPSQYFANAAQDNGSANVQTEPPAAEECRDVLNRLVRGGKIDSRSLQDMIARVAECGARDAEFARLVQAEFEKSCVVDSPSARANRDLLAVMARLFQALAKPRWVAQLSRLSSDRTKAEEIARKVNLDANRDLEKELLASLIRHAYDADRSSIAGFALAVRLLHHPDGRDFLRDVLRNSHTKWKDNTGGGWTDAQFVAAVGLAELNEPDGVDWLLSNARDNNFGIDGSLWTHMHVRDSRGSLRGSSRLSLANLFGLDGAPNFVPLNDWWRDNKNQFTARPVTLMLGLNQPQTVVAATAPDASNDLISATEKPQQPKSKEAQSLFKAWQDRARSNGTIPGGALRPLLRVMTNFVKYNPTHEGAPKFAELMKRIDVTRDWSPADAVALLDEVSSIYASLPQWVEDEPRFTLAGEVGEGKPLPDELKGAPWGEAQPNGLRIAWLLEPRAREHRRNTALKSRLLFHNTGKNTVIFRALTWNQSGEHRARDAQGAEINVTSTNWTTIPRVFACRLASGQFMEVAAAGIGVGANTDDEDWRDGRSQVRVGSWIEAKAGDEVTFVPAAVDCDGRDSAQLDDDGAPATQKNWWLKFIGDRLSLDAPLPVDAAERAHLLTRATQDLFGTAPTDEELTTFQSDRTPGALDALAERLAIRSGFETFSGSLQSGSTTFKVLPVDPDAAKKPRTAKNPGQYPLGNSARFVVSRRPIGERIVNEAHIAFAPADATKPAPREPHVVQLPDDYDTWAAAWMRGGTVLWICKNDAVHKVDFTDPAKVVESIPELGDVPKAIRDALAETLLAADKTTTDKKASGSDVAPPSVKVATNMSRPSPSSWSSFRHNLTQTGIASSNLTEKLVPLWETKLRDAINGTAAIVNRDTSGAGGSGDVYVSSLSGELICFDKNSGRVLWTYRSAIDGNAQVSPGFRSSPTVTADKVYLGDEDGWFHAIDRLSGVRRWTFRTDGEITGSAMVTDGRIVFRSYDHHIYCLNEQDGGLVWKLATESQVHVAPSIVGDNVVVVGCDGRLRVIDFATGRQKSDCSIGKYLASSPVIVGDVMYLGSFGSGVMGVNWRTGNLLWRYQSEQKDSPFLSSPAVTDKLVVIGGHDKHVHAIDRATGTLVWKFATGGKENGSPVIVGQRVFIGSEDGHLYELDLASGKQRAKFPLNGATSASPAIGEGVLVIGTEDGRLVCFGDPAKTGQVIRDKEDEKAQAANENTVQIQLLGGEQQVPLGDVTVVLTRGYGSDQKKYGPFMTDDSGSIDARLPYGTYELHLDSRKELPFIPVDWSWNNAGRGPTPWLSFHVSETGVTKWVYPERHEPTSHTPQPPRVTFRLLTACELTLRVIDVETGEGLPGVEFQCENATGEEWAHSIDGQNIGWKKTDTAADQVTDKDGNFRRRIGANGGYTYFVSKSPPGYELVEPDRIEVEIPVQYGQARAERVFKFRRIKDRTSDNFARKPTEEPGQ